MESSQNDMQMNQVGEFRPKFTLDDRNNDPISNLSTPRWDTLDFEESIFST